MAFTGKKFSQNLCAGYKTTASIFLTKSVVILNSYMLQPLAGVVREHDLKKISNVID